MMNKLYALMAKPVASDEGATAVEYGIMVAAIAAVIVAIVILLGKEIAAAFQTVLTAISAL